MRKNQFMVICEQVDGYKQFSIVEFSVILPHSLGVLSCPVDVRECSTGEILDEAYLLGHV